MRHLLYREAIEKSGACSCLAQSAQVHLPQSATWPPQEIAQSDPTREPSGAALHQGMEGLALGIGAILAVLRLAWHSGVLSRLIGYVELLG